jgi:hypothetical protein
VRFCLDTEFIEDGRTIKLISIGIAAEDGDEYYAIDASIAPIFDQVLRHPWLAEHVVPHLPTVHTGPPYGIQLDLGHPSVKMRYTIAQEVRAFLVDRIPGEPVELWANYGAYDHIALCQLWGPMVDKPEGIPMFTHDLQQRWEDLGRPGLPEQRGGEHHALDDARYDWEILHTLDLIQHSAAGQR